MPSIQKKICLLGDFAVGKTSLVRRFVEDIFEDTYLSTIGAKVSRKVLTVDDTSLTLLIWDLAGGEKFTRVMDTYYRGAAGAILVCDLTRAETLPSLNNYARNLWQISPRVPLVIAGNKADLEEQRDVAVTELASRAAQINAFWLTTSAKTGENVDALFHALGRHLLNVR